MGGDGVHERQSAEEAIVDDYLCLYASGCAAAAEGYLRARRPERKLLISDSLINRNSVTLEELAKIAPSGVPDSEAARTSTETRMQQPFFADRTYVGASVHAHPAYGPGLTTTRIPLEAGLLPEVIVSFGSIALAEYATPSTGPVADSLRAYGHATSEEDVHRCAENHLCSMRIIS